MLNKTAIVLISVALTCFLLFESLYPAGFLYPYFAQKEPTPTQKRRRVPPIIPTREDWLIGWLYRKSHVINAAAGAGTDYQIRITVHYGNGTDDGEDVYLSEKCRTDFGDVWWTDNDGITLLSYYILSKTDGNNAVFWIKVSDSLESSVTIFIYYGHSEATTISNINNTFISANDFENDVVDTVPSPWVEDQPALFNIRVKDDSWYVKEGSKGTSITSIGGGSGFFAWRDIAIINENNNRAIEFWLKTNINWTGIQIRIRDETTDKFIFSTQWTSPNLAFQYHNGSSWITIMNININTWYRIKIYNIDFTNRQFDLDIDGINKVLNGTFYASATQLTRFSFRSAGVTSGVDYGFDTFFIRKFVDPEPTHGAWGSEETY